MEQPLLRLGLLGFDQDQALQATLRVQSAACANSRWQVVSFEDADMWLLHSSRVSMGSGGTLVIGNPASPGSPMTVDPAQASRPVAFTSPLPPTIDAKLSINLDDAFECATALNLFSRVLMRLCTFFALGEQVASRQSGLERGIYQLHFESKLVAVVDLSLWQVGMLPDANPLELALASWRHRPYETNYLPEGFKGIALDKLMWVYASRTQTDRLPASYRTEPIQLRRLSVVPQSWLHQDHMNVIGLISQQPCLMSTLAQRTQMSDKRLASCLTALYYSGTITTDPRQVLRGDSRIHSGYVELSEQDKAAYTDTAGDSKGLSVFDTHDFAATRN
jgi:hypothetical protein